MKSSFELWELRKSFKLHEAALLITNNDPDKWSIEKLLSSPPAGFRAIYGLILTEAVNVIDEGVESEVYQGQYYTEYALMTDKLSTLNTLTEAHGLKINVERTDLLQWLKVNPDIPNGFFEANATSFEVKEKPLDVRERNSLHRIIGALLLTLLEEAKSNPKTEFLTQEALIFYLDSHFDSFEGISKSNLEKIFPICKELLGYYRP